MDKYTRRRIATFGAIAAIVGTTGFGILTNVDNCGADNAPRSTFTMQNSAADNIAMKQTEVTHLYKQCSVEPNLYSVTGVYLTESEIDLLSRLVYLEGGTESFECQKAIASTVINRMLDSGDTLAEVIYAENQYAVADMLDNATASKSAEDAVSEVLRKGVTVPGYVTFFRADYYHEWGDQVPFCCIDHTYFSYSQAMLDTYRD